MTVSPPSGANPVGASSGRTSRPARTSAAAAGSNDAASSVAAISSRWRLAELSTCQLDGALGRLTDRRLARLLGGADLLGAAAPGMGGAQLVAAVDDIVDQVGPLRRQQVDGPRRHRRLGQLGEGRGGLRVAGFLELADTVPAHLDEVLGSAGVQMASELVDVDAGGHPPTLADPPGGSRRVGSLSEIETSRPARTLGRTDTRRPA